MSTKAELLKIAEELGVEVPEKATKETINTLVKEALAAGVVVPQPVDNPLPVPVDNPPEDDSVLLPAEIVDEVSQALALREQTVRPTNALPSAEEYAVLGTLANRVYQTTFVPSSYRGKEADVFAAFLFGREIGLGPMMALRDVHMIDGRPALAAHRQLALLRKGGVQILESESTTKRAMIKAQRSDTGETMTVEFTWDEATTAKLNGKDNWKNYPADMLWARAVGRLTRRLGPDLLNGLPYVAEELADLKGWDVTVGDTEVTYEKRDTKWNAPKGWKELVPRLKEWLGDEEMSAWMGETLLELYGVEDTRQLEPKDLAAFGVLLAKLLYELEQEGDLTFAVDRRQVTQRLFAKVFNGYVPEGPEWALSPKEAETHPQKSEVFGAVVEPVDKPVEESTEQAETAEWADAVAAEYDETIDF